MFNQDKHPVKICVIRKWKFHPKAKLYFRRGNLCFIHCLCLHIRLFAFQCIEPMFVSPMLDMFLAIMGKLNQVGAKALASIRIVSSF